MNLSCCGGGRCDEPHEECGIAHCIEADCPSINWDFICVDCEGLTDGSICKHCGCLNSITIEDFDHENNYKEG